LLHNLLKSYQSAEEKVNFFPLIEKIFNQLENTINGLTEILQVQNISEQHVKKVYLNAVVEDIESSLKASIKKNDTLTFDFEKAPSLRYVHSFLESVLKNLISNSIKYRKKDSPLNIHLESNRVDGFILVSVKDNGIGIDLEKYKNHLFQPFKRFTLQETGTGVGLYLIKSIISRNGGKIVVESNPGEGTTFKCYLKEY
jgi:signal transduction histidine kinase